jgi:hypothetical protein
MIILGSMVSPAPSFRTPPQPHAHRSVITHAYVAPRCIWAKQQATVYHVNTTAKVVLRALQEVLHCGVREA